MPFDSNGNASITRTRAVTGQTVLADQVNVPFDDVQAMFNSTFLRSGIVPMSGPLNMNGYTITNLPEGTNPTDPVNLSQLEAVEASITNAVPPGTVAAFRRKTAPTGWVKENGGTIGSAASGATTRANADTINLYTVLWNEFDNTELPIQTSGGSPTTRGASAAADFAANKRMPLFDSRSRYQRGADDGLGYDATLTVGAIQADAIKNHVHTGTTASAGDHAHDVPKGTTGGGDGAQSGPITGGSLTTSTAGAHTHTFTTDNNTGGIALETRVRSSVVLYCIKL